MQRFSPLTDLLMDNLFVAMGVNNTLNYFRLKEPGAHATLKQVDIIDIPADSLLIKTDNIDQPCSLFKSDKGARKRCDYILITMWKGAPLLLFIEMKSGNACQSDINRQFKGAECLIDYCNAALDRFHDQNGVLQGLKKRFVVFYRPKLAKQRTRPALPTGHTTPETAFRYPAPVNPSLKALVGA
jgi:hypothetical protein